MAITKEKAIDILDKIDFFEGQRAGRELWNEKPRDVQELDLRNFQRDVALLKEYINTAEVEKIFAEIEEFHKIIYDRYVFEDNDYAEDDVAIECAMNYGTDVSNMLDELKKKYIGDKR